MHRYGRHGRAASPVLLAALVCGLSGCSLASGYANSAPATPTPRPATPASAPLTSATGTWVFKSSDTIETLRLRQGHNGTISGSGDSTRSNAQGQVGHFSIGVHSGRLRNGTLSLTLYVTRTDTGSGLTVVEYLQCAARTRVLHCRMSLPLYKVSNAPQDFYRHPR